MLAAVSESFLVGSFGRLGYLAPFLFLVGAGCGLPVPEEVTMVGSGYLVHVGRVNFFGAIAVCWVATLLGDSVPFWVGRLLGSRALSVGWVARVLHPERIERIEQRVHRHGNWAVFTCRFLPGVRMPGFFTAGTAGMHYGRFLFFDALAACLMVPLYVAVGRGFGEHIGALERTVQNGSEVLGFALLLALTTLGVVLWVRRGDRPRTTGVELQGPPLPRPEARPEIDPPDPPQGSGNGAGSSPGDLRG